MENEPSEHDLRVVGFSTCMCYVLFYQRIYTGFSNPLELWTAFIFGTESTLNIDIRVISNQMVRRAILC